MTLGVTRRLTLALCVCAGVMGLVAGSARAATLIVTTTADPSNTNGQCATSGPCSLRQAVNTANAHVGVGDTISLMPGIYTLSATFGELLFTKDATLTGAGASSTAIAGNNATRLIAVASPSSVTISGVTLVHGKASGASDGGAVLINPRASLAISGAVLSSNSASHGGAIDDQGNLTVQDSSITGNVAANDGGAIMLDGTTTAVATAVVTNSTLSGNHADQTGGAIRAQSSGASGTSLTVTASSVISNTSALAGGAIEDSNLTMPAHVSISDSTIAANTTTGSIGGGGLYIGNGPSADQIINDTIVGNNATGTGSGGDVKLGGGATPVFENTIVAAGTAPGGPDCSGPVTTLGHNLDDTHGCGFVPPPSGSDLIDTAPMLRPLQSYGGPTPTIALLAGSPAIDAGANAGCPATDQRGVPRPQGAACDIGAYEVAPPVLGTPAASAGTTIAAISAPVANPDVEAGTVEFQFGTSTSYGTTTPAQTLAASAPATSFPLALTGLTPGTTYHVRVVAQNPDGTVYGSDQQFTTAATPPVSLPILTPAPPANTFTLGKVKVSSKGKLTVSLGAPDAGRFTARATFSVRVKKVSHKGKKRVVRHIMTTYTYGTGSASSSGMSTVMLTIHLKGSAGRELKKLGHVKVKLTVTFTPTGGKANKETKKVTVRRSRKGKYT